MPSLTGNSFDPNKDIPDLSGNVYIVTGGSAGIGFGIVAHLLQKNAAKIIILSNKEEHADAAMDELQEHGDTSRVHWQKCNLADLQQTAEVAHKLASDEKKIDGLILNAGLGVGNYSQTVNDLDSHFQVNHLSQLHLALTLIPTLLKTSAVADTRLVLMSSDLHRYPQSNTHFASVDEINTDLGPMPLYARSKLAQILTVLELQRRMERRDFPFSTTSTPNGPLKLFINATHPGAVETDQQNQAIDAYGTKGKIGVKIVRPFMKDPVREGCRSALYAATSPQIVRENISGKYIVPDCKVTSPSGQAQDPELAKRLWDLSVSLLKEKLGLKTSS